VSTCDELPLLQQISSQRSSLGLEPFKPQKNAKPLVQSLIWS